ncbi:hypothetical protein RYX36_015234, partial [Vicia faba]
LHHILVQKGQGVADVFYDDFAFTGNLARKRFKIVDQLPMNVGDKHYNPLFPYGFGLTTNLTNKTHYYSNGKMARSISNKEDFWKVKVPKSFIAIDTVLSFLLLTF